MQCTLGVVNFKMQPRANFNEAEARHEDARHSAERNDRIWALH